jgi:MFS family permease
MLFRFSLYGFLKNQRYFEPFLVLFLLKKGLSFFLIGLLIAFREVMINLFEIPSGAIADVWGRRMCMILSFAAYIGSFLVFGMAQHLALLFLAMFLFAIGEAFRTGTHKAMIFTWLRLQGRAEERTRVYGYTRSWSKFGSAASVILAAVFVIASDNYAYIFYFTIIPYLLGIVNFLGYPKELDGQTDKGASLLKIVQHLREALRASLARARLRAVISESMGFEGVFHAVKDYLQPILKATAIVALARLVIFADLSETQQTALLVGSVYFALHVLSGVASRQAHRVEGAAGDEDAAAHVLWGVGGIVFVGIAVAAYWEFSVILIAAFVLLHVLQNFWRPIQISRLNAHSSESQGATVLSIESQARGVATMVIAPLLGLAVDWVRLHEFGGAFWPAGVLGGLVALVFFFRATGENGRA